MKNRGFIISTARDYDLEESFVQRYYDWYWPEKFYEKLEEEISFRAKIANGTSAP